MLHSRLRWHRVKSSMLVRMSLHIGVSSNVVCSTLMGNARASYAWNRQQEGFTLFYVLMYGVLLYKCQV